jgi:cell division protein FtsB
MVKSISDSHLLATQIAKSPFLDYPSPVPNKMKNIKTFIPIITALIAVVGSLLVAGMQMRSATSKQLNEVVQQINGKVLSNLEEQLQDLKDKNEALEEKIADLADDYKDLRRILVTKFGSTVSIPLRKLRPPKLTIEPADKHFRSIVVPEK